MWLLNARLNCDRSCDTTPKARRRRAARGRRFGIEPLEERRMLAVSVTRDGAAPYSITFVDDSSAIVDNTLFLRFNAARQLEWRTFDGTQTTFTNDLDTTLGGTQTAKFEEITTIFTYHGVGYDDLSVNLGTLTLRATVKPLLGGSTGLKLDDLEGALGSVEIVISGADLIELLGENSGTRVDDLVVEPIQFDSLTHVRVDRSPTGQGRISSDGGAVIDFTGFRDFTLDAGGTTGNLEATFAGSRVGVGANNYKFIGTRESQLVIEGSNTLDDEWTITSPLANSVLIDSAVDKPVLAINANLDEPFDIVINGLGGNDQLTVNVNAATGSDLFANVIHFRGGADLDFVRVVGEPSQAVVDSFYRPEGADSAATLEYASVIDFRLIASSVVGVADEVPAPALVVAGTSASDIFAFDTKEQTITVNKAPLLTYQNKSRVTLVGLFGNDTYGIDNGDTTNVLDAIRIADGSKIDEDRLVLSNMGKQARATDKSIRAPGRAPITFTDGGLERLRFGTNTLVDIGALVKLVSNDGGSGFPSATRTLTFKNKSDLTIEGPFVAVFKLPAGVNIANATGTTKFVTPGRRFIRFNLGAGRLEPSNSVSLVVKFQFASASGWSNFKSQGFSTGLFAGNGAA